MKLQEHKSKRFPRRRLVYLVFVVVGAVLNLLHRRTMFLLLVLSEAARVPLTRRFCQAYFPYATSHLAHQPGFRFSTELSRRFYGSSVRVLCMIGAYRELIGTVRRETLACEDADLRSALVRSLFELGEFSDAREAAAGQA